MVQVAIFVAMAAIMVLALLMPDFFDDSRGASLAMVAAASYVVVRIMHIVLFAIVGGEDPGIRNATLRLSWTVVIAAVLLVGGAYLGGTWQLVLVCVALAIDLVGPIIGGGRGWTLALGHFAERHSLIVIIALGESIVAIGIGAAEVPVTAGLLALVALGVALACALWVSYFDGAARSLEEAVAQRSGLSQVTTARDVYSYLHFLLVSGLILIALAMKSALGGTEKGLNTPLAGYAAFALGLGLCQFLVGLWAMRKKAGAPTKPAELIVGLAALALIPLAQVLPALAAVLVACALVIGWRVLRAV